MAPRRRALNGDSQKLLCCLTRLYGENLIMKRSPEDRKSSSFAIIDPSLHLISMRETRRNHAS